MDTGTEILVRIQGTDYPAGSIPEAPVNDGYYVRRNGEWEDLGYLEWELSGGWQKMAWTKYLPPGFDFDDADIIRIGGSIQLPVGALLERMYVQRLEIKRGVTSLPEEFCGYCENLVEVELPIGLISLNYFSFGGSGINSFVGPSTLVTLGDLCFSNCFFLQNVDLSETNVTIIPYGCFEFSIVTDVMLPPALQTIAAGAFRQCHQLFEIHIPSTVTSIGDSAFLQCFGLQHVYCYSTTAPTLGGYAFNEVHPLCVVHVPVGATGYGSTYGFLPVVYDL
jgi:hypothetical protein